LFCPGFVRLRGLSPNAVLAFRQLANLHILVNFFKNISADITISLSIFLKKFPQNLKNLCSKSIWRQFPEKEL